MSTSDDMDVDSNIAESSLITTFSGPGSTWVQSVELQTSSHYDKFEDFRNDANRALRDAFPVHRRPRNATASVLMLKWEDDDLGVNDELVRLREIFDELYHFDTEIWEIPSWRPAQELSNKVYEWKHQYCEDQVCPGEQLPLLIVYYGGHAEKIAHSWRWRSNLTPTSSVFLNWSTTQRILFDDTDADVLILLDTCYAGSARAGATARGKGIKEILAACGDGLPVPGVEHRSFTSLLTDELKDAAHENRLRGKILTVVLLHGNMDDNDKLRAQPYYAMVSKNGYHSISLIPFPVPGQLRPRITSMYGMSTFKFSVLSEDGRPCKKPARITLSIDTSTSPTEDLIGFLKNERALPPYVTRIKVEDIVNIENICEPDSSLTLVSRPLSMRGRGWDRESCLQCWHSDEKCIPGQRLCASCKTLIEQRRYRIWAAPSLSIRLEKLFEYLLPDALVSHLSVRQVHAFLIQHIPRFSHVFQLRLSVGFGEPWKFWAVELDPRTDELYNMLGFERDIVTERRQIPLAEQECISPVRMTSPPIVPIWVDPLLMHISIDCWLDGMIGNPEAGWQFHIFPDPSHEWQIKILDTICQHYRAYKPDHDRLGTTSYQTLRWALKLTVLSYIMGHAFLVPEEDTPTLFRSLNDRHFKGGPSEGLVCPRAANKYVKMMILPMMRLAAQRTVSGLHEILQAQGPDVVIWDIAFAVVFLCLVAISSTQWSLFERAFVCVAKNDPSFNRRDAALEAEAIDRELVVHIIGMFHDKFRTTGNSGGFNPLSRLDVAEKAGAPSISPFATRVRNVTELYFRKSVATRGMEDIGAERLLALFMLPFYQKRLGKV